MNESRERLVPLPFVPSRRAKPSEALSANGPSPTLFRRRRDSARRARAVEEPGDDVRARTRTDARKKEVPARRRSSTIPQSSRVCFYSAGERFRGRSASSAGTSTRGLCSETSTPRRRRRRRRRRDSSGTRRRRRMTALRSEPRRESRRRASVSMQPAFRPRTRDSCRDAPFPRPRAVVGRGARPVILAHRLERRAAGFGPRRGEPPPPGSGAPSASAVLGIRTDARACSVASVITRSRASRRDGHPVLHRDGGQTVRPDDRVREEQRRVRRHRRGVRRHPAPRDAVGRPSSAANAGARALGHSDAENVNARERSWSVEVFPM